MARDLYGELLSRALNRGAPQGHFAAYITPQEGGALRAMGGGVAPGGGQFMANGIPSFQEFGGVDPGIADPTGPTGGYGSAGFEMGFNDPSLMGYSGVSGVSQADVAAAEQAQRDAGAEGPAHSLDDMFTAFAPAPAPVSVPAAPEALHEIAARNLADINLDYRNTERRGPPGTPATYTEAGREALARDISQGGIGSMAPGTTLANNNPTATTEDVATVNQHSDRTGGYAVNDPYSGVSVPEGMNMGLVPAAMGTLAGFASPTMGLGMTFSGIPTLETMALDFARTDTGALGSAARGLQQGISTITNPINTALGIVTEPIDRLGGFLGGRVSAGASAVGNFIDENVVDPLGQYATDITGALPDLPNFSIGDVLPQGEPPVGAFQDTLAGGNQEVYVPPQPAPVTEPFVSDDADDAERQFAEIPPDILARILANVEFGRQRQQQQQQELGLV